MGKLNDEAASVHERRGEHVLYMFYIEGMEKSSKGKISRFDSISDETIFFNRLSIKI